MVAGPASVANRVRRDSADRGRDGGPLCNGAAPEWQPGDGRTAWASGESPSTGGAFLIAGAIAQPAIAWRDLQLSDETARPPGGTGAAARRESRFQRERAAFGSGCAGEIHGQPGIAAG